MEDRTVLAFLNAQAKNVRDPAFFLRKPVSVVVEQEENTERETLAVARETTELLGKNPPAQH